MRHLNITQSITNRESPAFEKYLQEISKIKLLTAEEEVNLCLLIKKGDQRAKRQLAEANLRFVVSVAKKYQNQGLSLPDLINEGNIGLMSCISRFDSSRGFKFISYAVWWIRQSILVALAEYARIVKLPLNKVTVSARFWTMRSVLEQNLEREPSAEELAEAMNIEVKEVSHTIKNNSRHLSLDSPFSDSEENTLLDSLKGEDNTVNDLLFHTESLKQEITRSLRQLTVQQKEVLCCFFGVGGSMPLSLDEIGKKFNLTAERIRQIKDKALQKLRARENADVLRSFL